MLCYCRQWEDAEIMVLLQVMYTDLDFISTFNIELDVLQQFLYEVYRRYNNIPFHNFKHCFCVTQMVRVCAISSGFLPITPITHFCLINKCHAPHSHHFTFTNAAKNVDCNFTGISGLFSLIAPLNLHPVGHCCFLKP